MKSAKKQPITDQGRRFVDAAHALGCDESEEHFNAALAKVARHKPDKHSPLGRPESKPKLAKE